MNIKLLQFILQSNWEAAAEAAPPTDVASREAMALGRRGSQDNLLTWGGKQRRYMRWEEVVDTGEVVATDGGLPAGIPLFHLTFPLSQIVKYVYMFLLILHDIRNFFNLAGIILNCTFIDDQCPNAIIPSLLMD
jgi:hypothetical protein